MSKQYHFVIILLAITTVVSAPLFTQTAQRVENLLNEPAITWAAAAVFVLEAADIETFSNPNDAFRYVMDRKWLPKNASAESKAQLDGISLLLIEAFKLKKRVFLFNDKKPSLCLPRTGLQAGYSGQGRSGNVCFRRTIY